MQCVCRWGSRARDVSCVIRVAAMFHDVFPRVVEMEWRLCRDHESNIPATIRASHESDTPCQSWVVLNYEHENDRSSESGHLPLGHGSLRPRVCPRNGLSAAHG